MNQELDIFEAGKLTILRLLSNLFRLGFARGRVTISEFAYRVLRPRRTIVTKRVGRNVIGLDLAQPELRYIYFEAFEPNERAFLKQFLGAGDVVIDVGANHGYLSAICLENIGPNGKVYAIEANPSVFQFLDTLKETAGDSFDAYNVAATAQTSNIPTERVAFYVNPFHEMWASTRPEYTGIDSPRRIMVDCMSLGDFMDKNAVVKLDLIKIDVEGSEADVIRGLLPKLDPEHRPSLLCEVANTKDVDTIAVITRLISLGYGIYRIGRRGRPVEVSFAEFQSATSTANYLFAVPSKLNERI